MTFDFNPPPDAGLSYDFEIVTLDDAISQIKMLKSWLFMLTESLSYTLNNLETDNFTQSTRALLSPEVGAASDAFDEVVEQRESGIWSFRKWKCGMAELWGKESVSGKAVGVQRGELYTGEISPGVNYPFGFSDIPKVFISVSSLSSVVPFRQYTGSRTATGPVSVFSPVSADIDAVISYYVVGQM